MDFRSAFQEADTGVPFSNKSLIIAANSLLSQLKLLSEEQKLPAVDILLTSIWLSVHRKEDHSIRTPDSASLTASDPINVLQGDALQAESDNLPSSLIKTAPYSSTCIPAIDHDDTLHCEKEHLTAESSSVTIGSLIDNAVECTLSCKGGPCDHNNLHQTNSGCSNATCVAGKDNALFETVQTLNIGLTKCIPSNTTSHDVPPCRGDRETIRNENGIEDIDTDVSDSCSSTDKNKGNLTNHFIKDNIVENNNAPLKPKVCNHIKVRHTCSPIPDKQLVNGNNDNCVCPKDQSKPRSEDAVQEEQRCVLKKDCNCNISSVAAANQIKQTESELGLCDQVDSQVCLDSVADSKDEAVVHSESQTCLSSITGSDTVVKTSDGKTFQISSNHGLTFEDSFVIEKVDSDDSDDEMGDDHDTGHLDEGTLQCELEEDPLDKTTDHQIGKRTDEQVSSKRCKLACAPLKDTDQTAHPCSLISVFDGRSVGSQGSNNAEKADGVDTCNETERDKIFIMNYTESEQCMSEPKQNTTANYNLNSLDQAQFERASLGGIISTDNDTDLKIINIAGGVNFYDENEESVSLEKNADYKLTKHVENFPISFDRLTPSLSSCSSLYPNVIYSTISEPFMSVDQRPAIHDPSGLLVPSQVNFNACLGNDFRGRIYQQFADENIYINAGQQNIAQTYPYLVPDADNPYWHPPIKSEVIKSESKVLTASKYISASKKKKKHSKERKDNIERDSCLKNFYNIRDANGKFIKMPYVNNIHNITAKTSPNSVVKLGSVNGAPNTGTKLPALKQNQFNSIGTYTSPKMMYAKKAQPVNTKKQSASLKLKLSNKLLENELLKIDQRLGVLRAKTKGTSKNKLTKREKKTLRYLAKKRVTIHNKIVAAKKKLNASEKPKLTPSYEAQPKSNECNPQEEYVVKETNTRVNPDGSTQEYKVVVIKGILPKGGKQVPKNTAVIKKRRIEEEDSKQLTLTQTKKKNSTKGKGNSTPKNSLLVPQSTRPVTFCKKEVEHLKEESTSIVAETKLKNSKSKAVGKKVLKLKNSILNKTKDIPAKKKHKTKKKPVVASAHDNTAAPSQPPTMEIVESVLNFDTDNNLPEFDTGKPTIDKSSTCNSVVKKKGRPTKSHKKKAVAVKELVETEKTVALVDELKGRPTKSHKKKAVVVNELVETEKPVALVDELIQLHHGERGAKLAAQQRISAYNESLSADFISQGSSTQQL